MEYSREDLFAHSSFELQILDPIERERLLRIIQEQGRLNGVEANIRTKSGKRLTVLYFSDIIVLGGLAHSVITMVDVTDRKKAEEALRESEDKYRRIVKTAQEGIWLIDQNDRTVFVNQKMSDMLGFSIDEIFGQSPQKFMAPEFRIKAKDRLHEHMQGTKHFIDYRFIRKDGSDLWCILSSSPLFDNQGKYSGSLAMITNITERKRAEEALKESEFQYRTLFDSIDEGFCIIEMIFDEKGKPIDYRFLETNPSFEKQTGLIDAIGKRMRELAPKHEEHWFEIYGRISLTGEPARFQNPAKQLNRYYDVYAFRFGQPEKKQVAILFNDITRSKLVEEALKIAYETSETKVHERTMELEKAYNSLKESERNLAEAQEMAHLGSWERNLRTGKIYWSEEMFRIFGLQPQEFNVTYETFLSLVHPDDREYVDKAAKGALKEKPFSIEYRIPRDNGEVRIINAKGEAIFDENNTPIRLRGSVQDITERKQLEEQIRQRAEELEAIMDIAPVAIFIGHDPQSSNITGNRKANEYSEAEAGENISASITNERRFFHKGRELTSDELPNQQAALKNIDVRDAEIEYILSSGERKVVLGSASPLRDSEGNVRGSVGAFIDITERKIAEEKLRESEERYRNIVETANEGILIIDNKAIITYINPKIKDMFGYTLEEVTGRPIWSFISEEYRPVVKEHLEKRSQGISESYELKVIHKDGSLHWISLNAKSLSDKDGKFVGTLSMLTDITERKAAEEILARIQEARIKEIHHRIKNNLQVISSLLDLEAEKFSDTKTIEAFKESQSRVASMALIHEELYQGKDSDNLDFAAYVKKLAKELFSSYNLRNEDINLKLGLEQIYLGMDAAIPLGIIINELVSNSLKHAFSDRKKWEIDISLKKIRDSDIDQESSKADIECSKGTDFQYILTVADDGKGIPEEINLQNPDTLGLQLVTILVDQIDGCIELKRNPGTEFIIWFNNI